MVEIEIKSDKLFLEVKGSHKFWAFKNRMEVPLSHVKSVRTDPNLEMGWSAKGLKVAGTGIPNVFRAGTFIIDGEKAFWDVRNKENAVVIELRDEGYARLVVEVADPFLAVKEISRALINRPTPV